MPLFTLDKELYFPPVKFADEDGLLALGGDLSTERLLLAYKEGIFPWYESEIILWWSPNPRFVLFPHKIRISKTVKPLLKKNFFQFTTNKAFDQVIRNCQTVNRRGQEGGTWITKEVERAFNRLHKEGHAHSAEVWLNNELVGGLYGIRMGKVFFGESMFSLHSQASRYAFIKYTEQLKQEGVLLIDCQVHTNYLESLGAEMIDREEFRQLLNTYI